MNNRNTWAPETWLLLLITSRRKKRSESDKTHCSQTLSTARVSSLYVQKMLRGWARLRELESSNHPAYRQTVKTRPLSYSHTVLGHLSSSCLQTFCLKKTWLISQGQLKWKNKKTKLSILLFCLHSNPHLEISFLRGLAGGSFRDWVMVQAQSRTAALGGSSIWPLGPLPREVVLGLAIWEQTPGRTKDMLEKLYPLGPAWERLRTLPEELVEVDEERDISASLLRQWPPWPGPRWAVDNGREQRFRCNFTHLGHFARWGLDHVLLKWNFREFPEGNLPYASIKFLSFIYCAIE